MIPFLLDGRAGDSFVTAHASMLSAEAMPHGRLSITIVFEMPEIAPQSTADWASTLE
jgi:hypothetical protein